MILRVLFEITILKISLATTMAPLLLSMAGTSFAFALLYIKNTPKINKQETPKFKIKRTGKKVKVGGILGEVWMLKGEEGGKNFKEKVVVTNNAKVVKTMRAMFKSISTMSGGMLGSDNLFEPKKGYVLIKADGMMLESFKDKKVSKDEYKLPKVSDYKKSYKDRVEQKKRVHHFMILLLLI